MGDERTGRGTTGNVLQYRGIYLGISGLVEDTANGADDGGTLEEGVFDASVYDEVNVALTIAQFGVVEGIIYLPSASVFTTGSGFRLLLSTVISIT